MNSNVHLFESLFKCSTQKESPTKTIWKKKRDDDILVRLIKKKEIELAMRQTADGEKKNIKESSTSKDRR